MLESQDSQPLHPFLVLFLKKNLSGNVSWSAVIMGLQVNEMFNKYAPERREHAVKL